jgi:hypothetical protein
VQHTAADNLISLAPALLLRDGFSGLGVLASGGVMSLSSARLAFLHSSVTRTTALVTASAWSRASQIAALPRSAKNAAA